MSRCKTRFTLCKTGTCGKYVVLAVSILESVVLAPERFGRISSPIKILAGAFRKRRLLDTRR